MAKFLETTGQEIQQTLKKWKAQIEKVKRKNNYTQTVTGRKISIKENINRKDEKTVSVSILESLKVSR